MRSNHDDFDLQPQGHFEVHAVILSVRVNMGSSKVFLDDFKVCVNTSSIVGVSTSSIVSVSTSSIVSVNTSSIVGVNTSSIVGVSTRSIVGVGTSSIVGVLAPVA
jgi:hypothetical protein